MLSDALKASWPALWARVLTASETRPSAVAPIESLNVAGSSGNALAQKEPKRPHVAASKYVPTSHQQHLERKDGGTHTREDNFENVRRSADEVLACGCMIPRVYQNLRKGSDCSLVRSLASESLCEEKIHPLRL